MPITHQPFTRGAEFPPHAGELLHRYGHTESIAAFNDLLQKQDALHRATYAKQQLGYGSRYHGATAHLSESQLASLYGNYGIEEHASAMQNFAINQARLDAMSKYAQSTDAHAPRAPYKIGTNYEKKQDDHDMKQLREKHEREELKDIKMHGRRLMEEYHRHNKTDLTMTHQQTDQAESKFSHEMARLKAVAAVTGAVPDKKTVESLKNTYNKALKAADVARYEREKTFTAEEMKHAKEYAKVEKIAYEAHVEEENCLSLFNRHKSATFKIMFNEHAEVVQSIDPAASTPKALKKPKAPKTPKAGTGAPAGGKPRAKQAHSQEYLNGIADGALLAAAKHASGH